ncbi:MAG: flagellar basal body rod protein FlgB [Alphaproteobacteria bacterium]|nr:flagellar basal body rod protein FlgB [Alphaproteobacteria bacterium]
MTTQNLALFKAIGAKMDYLNQRQRIIAQNVSNSDTPGYQPKDLVPVDFSKILKDVTDKNSVSVATTDDMHMPPAGELQDPKSKKQKETYEVAPAGNAVIMEEQLINANQNVADYNLMTNLLQKNVSMLRTAIGRGQGQ